MKKDEILLSPKRKASPYIVKEIRRLRNKGLSFAELARRFSISRSYAHYLCLEGEDLEKYRTRMAINSKEYYNANRERLIEESKFHQRINRQKKAAILKKAQRKKCYTGRTRTM